MKSILLFAGLSAFALASAGGSQLKVLDAHYQRNLLGRASGYGHGNLIEHGLHADSIQAVDFAYTNCIPFERSIGEEAYRAEWREAGKLEIITQRVGSQTTDACTLKVTTHNFVYVVKDGQLTTRHY